MKRYVCVGNPTWMAHKYDKKNPTTAYVGGYEYTPMEIGWCKMMKLLKKDKDIKVFKTGEEAIEYCNKLNASKGEE